MPEKSPSPGGTGQDEAAGESYSLPSLQKARGSTHQGVATNTQWSAPRQPAHLLLLEDTGHPSLLPEQKTPTFPCTGKALSVCQGTRDPEIKVAAIETNIPVRSLHPGDTTELHTILPQ